MKAVEQIVTLYKQRSSYYAPFHSKMRTVQAIYNGTMEVPLPDMERSDMPSTPNLLAQGVDQMAGRISSVIPSVTFAEKDVTRAERRRVTTAARVVNGWWQEDRLPMKMKRRSRSLIAYGMAPTVIRWDPKESRPTWQLRHPLETFPSHDIIPGNVTPSDCLFAYRRSAAWLRNAGYGDYIYAVTGKSDVPQDQSMLLLEYIDEDGTQLVLTSYSTNNNQQYGYFYDDGQPTMKGVQMEFIPNFSGHMQCTVPSRITLDQVSGQFDNMIGMYYQQAKLMALEVIAVEKGVFPDTYLVSRPNEIARFIDGPHDGRTGNINIVAGGDIRDVQAQPGYLTNPTLDRLERAQRLTAGIPPEFGGESGGNIRTGRRGDAVLSAVIDFPVAEAQETFAYALEEENEIAIALAKAYAGDTTKTIFVGTGNSSRAVTYTPNQVFTESDHVVSYPATGTDVNSLIIGLGQRVGLGIMSKQSAARLDPFIENAEAEHDRIIAEGLEQALVAGLQQQATTGQIPPATLAKIMSLVVSDKKELAEALQQVTDEAVAEQQKAAEEQAQQQMAQGGPPQMNPAQMLAPATTAAMMGPNAAAPPSPVPGVGRGMEDLSAMLGALRRPAMTINPMRGVQTGAV